MENNSIKGMHILAVASGGGHWVQLMRLQPFLERFTPFYVSTLKNLDKTYSISNYTKVIDSSSSNKAKGIVTSFQLILVFFKIKPKVVVSTGALPGLIAILLGKYLFGAKTVWVDSIANGWEISLSGQIAKKHCDLFYTQWLDLAQEDGVHFIGSVI